MLKKCPFCGKETYDHAATKYCMYCSEDLTINRCTNKECFIKVTNVELPNAAITCPACGGCTSLHPSEPMPF